MISTVDQALEALIRRDALHGSDVDVAFDAPTRDWNAHRTRPTVNAYLYDIREDLQRRERGWINEYGTDNVVTHRHLPPRHFKLSYLVTAWTQRPQDEHRLLSALLACFLRHDRLPADVLTGPLAAVRLPVPITVATPTADERSLTEVWSALGGELKPSLDVVVRVPLDAGHIVAAGPPVLVPPRVIASRRDGSGQDIPSDAARAPASRPTMRRTRRPKRTS